MKTDTYDFGRKAGVLLHITSLPSPYGIGDLGAGAYRFVDWLKSANLRLWQVLPLVPPSEGASPYFAWSAFAANPLLIDLYDLHESGLLDESDLVPDDFPLDQIDQEHVQNFKIDRVHQAAELFLVDPKHPWREEFESFRQNAAWLPDAALYRVLRNIHKEAPWQIWPSGVRNRHPQSLAKARRENAALIERCETVQFFFERQWQKLRTYANDAGIQLIGDLPIYVAHESADVWAHRKLFQLEKDGTPKSVSGVPPDAFSETGQLWGNPLYDWKTLAKGNYQWWRERVKRCLEQTDLVRIDHFRAFESYWSVPTGSEDAIGGEWITGPGEKFFNSLKKEFGPLPIIAEDLGLIDEKVHALRQSAGLPGMRIL
ncbi:4-alpha-glucanotransferase, partial [Myxococcota bacterium]|nr:4-alpha-glucanotransferase [Myxococcota bacterium]